MNLVFYVFDKMPMPVRSWVGGLPVRAGLGVVVCGKG